VSRLVSSTRRVLVVDDYLDSRFVMCVALTMRGHTCDHVGTAGAAIASIATFRPDVVLLEWALRDGSGVGLALRLRRASVELGLALRIIAVSSQNEPTGFSVAEGFESYFSKPVAMDQLDETLRVAGA
jgi:two-component system phosphate regulon response regulator PhoB